MTAHFASAGSGSFVAASDAVIEEALGMRPDRPARPDAMGSAAPPPPQADWRAVISPAGYDFIVRWETGGKAYYEQVIRGRPVWPGYTNGPGF